MGPQVISAFQSADSYQQIRQGCGQIIKLAAISDPAQSGLPDLAVFYTAAWEGKITYISQYSVIGVVILRASDATYSEEWGLVTDFESPLASQRYWRESTWANWKRIYYDALDITGDGQPEIIIGSCTGFGNRCYYGARVWTTSGEPTFTRACGRFAGIQFFAPEHVIATHVGINIDYSRSEASLHPEEWQIDFWRWDGAQFSLFDTQVLPYERLPAVPTLPTP